MNNGATSIRVAARFHGRPDNGDSLVHVACDLRSSAERKRFVTVDAFGMPNRPEAVRIIVRIARARETVERFGPTSTRPWGGG